MASLPVSQKCMVVLVEHTVSYGGLVAAKFSRLRWERYHVRLSRAHMSLPSNYAMCNCMQISLWQAREPLLYVARRCHLFSRQKHFVHIFTINKRRYRLCIHWPTRRISCEWLVIGQWSLELIPRVRVIRAHRCMSDRFFTVNKLLSLALLIVHMVWEPSAQFFVHSFGWITQNFQLLSGLAEVTRKVENSSDLRPSLWIVTKMRLNRRTDRRWFI